MKINAMAQEMAQTMMATLYILDTQEIKLKSFSCISNTIAQNDNHHYLGITIDLLQNDLGIEAEWFESSFISGDAFKYPRQSQRISSQGPRNGTRTPYSSNRKQPAPKSYSGIDEDDKINN